MIHLGVKHEPRNGSKNRRGAIGGKCKFIQSCKVSSTVQGQSCFGGFDPLLGEIFIRLMPFCRAVPGANTRLCKGSRILSPL